jgi:hypothetical protein
MELSGVSALRSKLEDGTHASRVSALQLARRILMSQQAGSPAKRRQLRSLAWAFVVEMEASLRRIGIWPRPPRSRRLEWGGDFHYNDFQYLASFRALNDWMSADPDLNALYGIADGSVFAHVWIRLVTRVLALSATDSPDERVFDAEFALLWNELRKKRVHRRTITTLVGVELRVGRLTLDKDNCLLPLPWRGDYANRWLCGQFRDFEDLDIQHDVHSAYVTQKTLSKNSLEWDYSETAEHASGLHDAITAFRLYTPGVVRAARHYELQVSRFPVERPTSYESSGSWMRRGVLGGGDEGCVLGRPDLARVRSIWTHLTERRKHSRAGTEFQDRLSIAIDRFNSSYETVGVLQQLVDLTIALEALLGSDDTTELVHRIRLRAAFLLGRDDDESRAIYDMVGRMYDIRSRVLHGAPLKKKDYAKWLSKLSGQDVSPEHVAREAAANAVASARRIVRRGILGALGLESRPGTRFAWPLPKDFDHDMSTMSGKRLWQRSFGRPIQEWLAHYQAPKTR